MISMMNKDDWYTDRILWRANQHNLFDKSCIKYSELDNSRVAAIEKAIPGIEKPVLAFWDSEKKWTVLCALHICSFFEGQLVSSGLDEIDKSVSVVSTDGLSGDIKKSADVLCLDKLNKSIWAPAGSELFALMSILQMFPLRLKNTA